MSLITYKPMLDVCYCAFYEESLIDLVISIDSVLSYNRMNGLNIYLILDNFIDKDTVLKVLEKFKNVSINLIYVYDAFTICHIPDILIDCVEVIYLDCRTLVKCDLYKYLKKIGFNEYGIVMSKSSLNIPIMFIQCTTLRRRRFLLHCDFNFDNIHNTINKECNGNIIDISAYLNIDDFVVSEKKINLGILYYHNDDLSVASTNIGDYIQSIATINYYKKFLQHKFNIVYNNFDDFLHKVLHNEIEGVNFVFVRRDDVCRDVKGYDKILLVMNGWWMHPTFKTLLFNIPDNVTPLFISFHINNMELLKPPFIDIFKKYEPIGCRDMNSLTLLNKCNVKTYFSGCLTVGIDFLSWNNQTNEILYVDVRTNKIHTNLTHESKDYKNMDYHNCILIAYRLLKTYSTCKEVITSRLHCYLPCIAMNIPVTLRSPYNRVNVKDWGPPNRFKGLVDIINKTNKKEYIALQRTKIFDFIDVNLS